MSRSRLTGAFVGALLTLAGCTVTRPIERPQTVEQLQALVWPKHTSITLLHDRPEGARSPVPPWLAPTAAVLTAPDPDAGSRPLVDLSDLHGYEVKRRVAGTFEGLGIGLLSGFVAGALVGMSMGDDGPCHNDDGGCVMFGSGDKALFLGILGAVPGAVIGTLTGLLVGHTDRYVFAPVPPRP